MLTIFARRMALAVLLCCGMGLAQAQVVISQVYGGGGNSGASYKNDFIELRNNGSSAVSVNGWSVQYASATGSTWQRTNLVGSIPARGYYLIRQAQGAGGTVDLPAPDASGTIAMAASAGKVALVATTTALAGACPLAAAVDFVGFGSTANCFEGAGPTPAPSNTTAALRAGDGATDSNNNNADFSTGAPNPRNTSATPPPPPEPALALTIAQIQGAGVVSAHDDKRVVTEGIVTARRFNNGFFLQSANDDGDPATSDGIFVFTGSAPPASAAVGNRVRVTAKVEEFVPSSNSNQLSITELVSPVIEVVDTGNALPPAIELVATDLGADATPATLERFEGMRVSVAESIAVAPSEGSIDENDALSFTDGVFYVTLPGITRPFREPGIGVLDATPIPAGKSPPRFDTNPERLMVRSRGQIGAAPVAVDRDARIGGLLGVLDYNNGTWALLPDATTPPAVSGGAQPLAVAEAGYEDIAIGSFNLLRFFDEVNDNNGAVALTPAALEKRMAKTSAAICDYVKAPDILGVVEVENLRVLGLLADRINATCARAPGYVPFLVEGNDVGGIDVGFLVATREVAPGTARIEVVQVTQFGKDATLQNPDGSTSLLNDRPPLLLRAIVHQDNGASYPVTIIANHLRSLNDVDSTDAGSNGWPTSGHRVRAKRGAQAAYLAGLVEQLQQTDPAERIVLLGDFNAFEFNDGYVDVLGVIKGEEAPEDQVLTYVDSPLSTPLVDGSQLIADAAEHYSYSFAGNAQTLDHVLVNEPLLLDAGLLRVDHARINADFGTMDFGDAAKPTRTSDHDPVRLRITVPAFRSADLAVTAAATPATIHVGDVATFTAGLGNAGPSDAAHAAVAFVFDAPVSPAVNAPSGWTCATPAQDGATTTVTCTMASFVAGGSAAFSLDVAGGDALGGRSLRMAVAAASQVHDPANANNQATASVAVTADADLSVSLSGPVKKLHYGRTETFPLVLRNAGPDAAWQPVVTLRGDAPAANVSITPATGWSCVASDAPGGFEARCSFDGVFAASASQRFDFAIRIPARPDSTMFLSLAASAQASTPDPDSADNAAAYSNRIVGVP